MNLTFENSVCTAPGAIFDTLIFVCLINSSLERVVDRFYPHQYYLKYHHLLLYLFGYNYFKYIPYRLNGDLRTLRL